MTPEQEFLFEEFKESIQTGQWFEESIARSFKNFSIVFIWNMIFVGLLLKDKLGDKDIWIILQCHPVKSLFVISSGLVIFYAVMTIANMLKTRRGDVVRTSRADFLRKYFLENMPVEFKKIYFEDKRLKQVNSEDYNARPPWSLTSEVALYTTLTGILGSIQLILLLYSFYSVPPFIVVILLATTVLSTIIISRSYLNHHLKTQS